MCAAPSEAFGCGRRGHASQTPSQELGDSDGQPSGIRPRSLGSPSAPAFLMGVGGKEAPRAPPPQGGCSPQGLSRAGTSRPRPGPGVGNVFSNPDMCCLQH